MIPIHCPLCCDQPFENQQALFFHLRGLRNNLFCSICSERFPTLETLVTHLSRTCNGPSSPSAKRKSLSLITGDVELDDGAKTFETKDNDNAGQITSSVSPPQGTQKDIEVVDVIPAEFRGRLSKSVTLTVEGATQVLRRGKVHKDKSINLSTNNVKSNGSCSVKDALEKVLKKPGVEVSLKIQGKSKESTKTVGLHRKDSSTLVNVTTSSHLTPKSNTLPGKQLSQLESVKLSDKRKSEDVPKQVTKKRKSDLNGIDDLFTPDVVKNQSSQVSTTTKQVETSSRSSNSLDTRKKRGRGRPRKACIENEPNINGTENKLVVVDKVETNLVTSTDIEKDKLIKHKSEKFTVGRNEMGQQSKTGHSKSNSTTNATTPSKNTKNVNSKENKHRLKPDHEKSGSKSELAKSQSNPEEIKSKPKTEELKSQPKPGEIQSSPSKTESSKENIVANGKLDSVVESKSSVDTEVKENSEEAKDKSDDDEEEEYTCSACNVRFTSIYDHIKKFHNGEEVVVEVPPDEIKEDLKAYQEDPGVAIELNSPDSTQDDRKAKSPEKVLNGLKKTEDTQLADKVDGLNHENKQLLCTKKPENIKKSNSAQPSNTNMSKKGKERPFLGGKWMHCPTYNSKGFYQYVNNEVKRKKLISELLETKVYHKNTNIRVRDLFENPKINLLEITNEKNSPMITHRFVDFSRPMPMYVTEFQSKEDKCLLGGIASYVVTKGTGNELPVPESSELIAVMKVVLGSDRTISVENISFKDKPASEHMIPFLEDVIEPKIPLLSKAKILKWRCIKCLSVTWKFPINTDSHECNSCPICHKTFASLTALRSHSMYHRKDGTKFCMKCSSMLSSRGLVCKSMLGSGEYGLCDQCNLLVLNDQKAQHQLYHEDTPNTRIPCSVCKEVFGTVEVKKEHEVAVCSRLVPKYNCDTCDKKFFSLSALNLHSNEHKNCYFRFPCRYCNKVFIREKERIALKAGHKKPSSFLRRIWHERIHTRHRPFLCSSCPKRFRSSPQQRSHFVSVHECPRHVDIVSHQCHRCGTKFASLQRLIYHADICAGPQPIPSTSQSQ